MTTRTTRRYFSSPFLHSGAAGRRRPSEVARLAGRVPGGFGWSGAGGAEHLEERVLLAGDHPSLVLPLGPASGTPLTLDSATPLAQAKRGRNVTGASEGTAGVIAAGDDGDLFRFVMPTVPGRTSDFVSVLADTQSRVNGTALNSTLDTYVEVYRADGTQITNGANNGVITATRPNTTPDGWAGFVGTPGETYYIRVRADPSPAAGRTTTGEYTLRIDTTTVEIALDTTFVANPDPGADTFGSGLGVGNILRPQDEVTYRIRTGSGPRWSSLATASASADDPDGNDSTPDVDTHLDVYNGGNAQGVVTRLASDEEAGRLNDAFATWRSQPDSTYFFRVRSDRLATPANPALGLPTGAFRLLIDAAALDIGIDPVTRLAAPDKVDVIPGLGNENPGSTSKLYQFRAQGTGRAFVTVIPNASLFPIPPLEDPAVRVFDENGTLVQFNDDFAGTLNPQLEFPVVGNTRYFVVVEGFDRAIDGAFSVFIEAHHTFDIDDLPGEDIDDHIDFPTLPNQPNRRDMAEATPIIWNDPFLYGDVYGNAHLDRSWVQQGVGRGRIYEGGDSDVFQFTPPVSMLSEYAGDDGNQGSALYVGGNFQAATRVNSPNAAIWDAGAWWQPSFDEEAADPLNDPPGAIDGPIFAMTTWDPTPTDQNPPLLIAGGQFTFVDGSPAGNLAVRVFVPFNPLNPTSPRFAWAPLGIDTNGPVFALLSIDILPDGGSAALPELVVGGDFTTLGAAAVSNVAAIRADGSVDALLGGVDAGPAGSGVVRALAAYDPPDAPDPDDFSQANPPGANGPIPDPPDKPLGLYVGGTFTDIPGITYDGQNVRNVARFGRPGAGASEDNIWEPLGQTQTGTPGTPPSFREVAPFGVDGPVFALAAFDAPGDIPNTTPAREVPNRLMVGGQITGFLASWDPADPFNGPRWKTPVGGVPGAVRAMTVYNAPDGAGMPQTDPTLVVGGDGATANSGVIFEFTGSAAGITGFTNGSVRALTAFTDDEFFSSASHADVYAGGDFTEVDPDGPGGDPPIPANRVARFGKPNRASAPGQVWNLMGNGVEGLSPGEVGTTSVFALHAYDDDIGQSAPGGVAQPKVWDRNERAATRVDIVVTPTTDGDPFVNLDISVYDSNFDLVFSNQSLSIGPNPPGSIDPARPDGGFVQISPPLAGEASAARYGFKVWGGEVYYLVVNDPNTAPGGGTGRYTVAVTVDALPPEDPNNGDGAFADVLGGYTEVPDAGQWTAAPEIILSNAGDGRTFLDPQNEFNPTSYTRRTYPVTPGGIARLQTEDLPKLERVDDTDLYKFRAPATGYAELRVATRDLRSLYQELRLNLIDNTTERLAPPEHLFDSPLDAALRVFSNDFNQIGYSNDSFALGGFGQIFPVIPNGGNRTFVRSDPRVVIPVVAGETYFVQVESGMLANFQSDPGGVDWRHAIGAYELLINANPSLNGIDDYPDLFDPPNDNNLLPLFQLGAAVPIVDATGDQIVTGVIDDVTSGQFQNPDDSDVFRFVATTRGQFSITLRADAPLLRGVVRIIDQLGTQVAQATGAAGAQVNVRVNAAQGDQFLVVVDGEAGSEGAYTLTINGPGVADDHANAGYWPQATTLTLSTFFGTYSGSGSIENPGDADLFTFTAGEYEVASVTIRSTSGTLDPLVRVYEINRDAEDPDGNPVFLLIGQNDDAGSGTDATSTFSVTAGRQYFILVEGSNPNLHFGNYTTTVSVAPTDDHPNRTDFPLATVIDMTVDALTQASTGTAQGVLEVDTDDDLFTFTATTSGTATVTLSGRDGDSAPAVTVLNGSNSVIATGAAGAGATTVTFSVVAGTQYYLQVVNRTPAVTDGLSYTLSVTNAPVDDHANEGQWGSATVITLSPSTGIGTSPGVLVPASDTDLFRFVTLAVGPVQVRMSTSNSTLNPLFRVYNSAFQLVGTATSNADTATLTFSAGAAGETYFILAVHNPAATGTEAVGTYQMAVTGTLPGGTGPNPGIDDHADANEWADATLVALNQRTGRGSAPGVINAAGDTDLFKFVAAASGPADVQIVTPAGGLVDGRVKVYNQDFVLIFEDASGIPGATAAVSFNATAGQTYFVLVEPVGSVIGSYTLRVGATPTTHFLYYPEGFAGSTIDEFVPLVNINSFAVQYEIFVRYETGEQRSEPIATGTLGANSRGGVTITTRNGPTLVDRGRAYALEIRSTGQLGATMSHYDFNVTVGENFTNQTSGTWTFSDVHKDRNTYRDFLVFYNPGDTAANLSITLFYEDGTTSSFTQAVGALRRGGVNVDTDGRIPKNGRFGVRVTSDQEIVAALSTYNLTNSGGDGLLGDSDGGSTVGVIPGVSTGGGVISSVAFLNTGTSPATVTVTISYGRLDLPDVTRTLTVQPGRTLSRTLAQLGVAAGQQAGIRYSSNVPVTASAIEYQNGDGNTTAAATEAARAFAFGDLFVNPEFAGVTYIENLGLYNPSATAIDVTLTFLFTDGTTGTQTVSVAAQDFFFVRIDQAQPVLARARPTAFSLKVTANTPIVASLTHYDLFLNGGWSALGSPIGLTNDLATL